MGPLNQPVFVTGYSNFESIFGGLWLSNTLGYSVSQFFQNGGGTAIVVRVASSQSPPSGSAAQLDFSLKLQAQAAGSGGNSYTLTVASVATPTGKRGPYYTLVLATSPHPASFTVSLNSADGDDFILSAKQLGPSAGADIFACGSAAEIPNSLAVASTPLTFSGGGPGKSARLCVPVQTDPDFLSLSAANPGTWGNGLATRLDYAVYPPSNSNLFNLTVQLLDPSTIGQPNPTVIQSEVYQNLSLEDSSPQYAPKVLAQESALVTGSVVKQGGAGPFLTGFTVFAGGDDGGAISDADVLGDSATHSGMFALDSPQSTFNLLCLPPLNSATDLQPGTYATAEAFCAQQRAMLLIDSPATWASAQAAVTGMESGPFGSLRTANAILFFPRIQYADPLQNGAVAVFASAGSVAGVMARTDSARGVWKAAAGTQANLIGALGLSVTITDGEQGQLNPLAVNCLRLFPITGAVVYGARTLVGADILQSQWKYVPVRRTALYIEDSLYAGLQFAVFEPNAEPLWSQIRLSVGSFLQDLFQQGAFAGRTPQQAYFVQCDDTNNTSTSIDLGLVTVRVGFAPVEPAEFVIVQLQLQSAP